jgi:hypothetical protein
MMGEKGKEGVHSVVNRFLLFFGIATVLDCTVPTIHRIMNTMTCRPGYLYGQTMQTSSQSSIQYSVVYSRFFAKVIRGHYCHVEVVVTHVECEIRASTGVSLNNVALEVGARDPVAGTLEGQYSTPDGSQPSLLRLKGARD